ncbi:MAG: hypothetical protein LBM93_09230 [Oscillospiraceae bacterium]|jgi:hypothetical protein|nr:hypothetical protein [Oscillospiraceae bacterium]
MKKLTAILLSMSLVLCSCGKSNDPLVKRELIDQSKHETPLDQATEQKSANQKETRPLKKIIPIKYFDKKNIELGNIEITVKGEEGATMNIDNLKAVIPKGVCNITEAFFWTDTGSRYTLTQEPVYIQHIHDIELTCDRTKPTPTKTPEPSLTPVPSSTVRVTPSASKSPEPTKRPSPTVKATTSATRSSVPSKIPTSKPSVKPSATATPKPSKTPEKKTINNKYSYIRIAYVVVAVIVAFVLIVKLAKRCKGGKTDIVSNVDGQGDGTLPGIVQHNEEEEEEEVTREREKSAEQSDGEEAKNEKKEEEQTNPEPAPEIDPDVARLQAVLSCNTKDAREVAELVIIVSERNKLSQISHLDKQEMFSIFNEFANIGLGRAEPKNEEEREFFKLMIRGINALGRLQEVQDLLERRCRELELHVDEIFSE